MLHALSTLAYPPPCQSPHCAHALGVVANRFYQVGDLPDADIVPPDNVLFVCKLNPHTTDEDLETIFSRFGEIVW